MAKVMPLSEGVDVLHRTNTDSGTDSANEVSDVEDPEWDPPHWLRFSRVSLETAAECWCC